MTADDALLMPIEQQRRGDQIQFDVAMPVIDADDDLPACEDSD